MSNFLYPIGVVTGYSGFASSLAGRIGGVTGPSGTAITYPTGTDGILQATADGILVGLKQFAAYTAVSAFQNSWANFGAGPNVAGYTKDALGWVHLRGAIASGTIGTSAFTLPAGYRPNAKYAFATLSNGAFGAVVVDVDGTVTPFVGSNVYMYLDVVHFLAEQ